MIRLPSVLIAEDGAEVAVRIVPPPHGPGHDQTFTNYLAARAYAVRLRSSFGWRVVDRCDNRTKLRALQRGYASAKPQKVDHGGSFIQLPRALLDSPAWHSLSMRARCLLLAIAFRFKGQNNGHIPASSRDLADAIGSGRYQANRAALGELMEAGLLVAERMYPKGSRMATEYRLTWIESGHGAQRQPATNEWRTFEGGNIRKNRGAETSTRNRKHADAPSTERKLRADAPSTGEVETPEFRADAPSTPLVSHLSGRKVVPFPSSETLQNTAGHFSSGAGMDLEELRSFARSFLKWAGTGAQSRLSEQACVPAGSLSKFLAGRSLADRHRLKLQLAIGRAWPLSERGEAA